VKNDLFGVKNDLFGVKNDLFGVKNDLFAQVLYCNNTTFTLESYYYNIILRKDEES
jgi:hypothetical protein